MVVVNAQVGWVYGCDWCLRSQGAGDSRLGLSPSGHALHVSESVFLVFVFCFCFHLPFLDFQSPPFPACYLHVLVSPALSLGSFGMSRTPAPSAGGNPGAPPEVPTSSPTSSTTPSPTGAQRQLMQQMIQLLAGSGNSQVHGAVTLGWGSQLYLGSVKQGSPENTEDSLLEWARPCFRPCDLENNSSSLACFHC